MKQAASSARSLVPSRTTAADLRHRVGIQMQQSLAAVVWAWAQLVAMLAAGLVAGLMTVLLHKRLYWCIAMKGSYY